MKNYLCRLAKHLAKAFPAQHGFEKLEKQKNAKEPPGEAEPEAGGG
ncbi:MAG: hypothetical protein KIH08_06570 [Candidatus Freyarchaeota archaeon]|nr:hypothetical protein [Candidatus Jordarchaeia archaeon]MBS7269438.1 hypothetical protein [Candidatus Jordarchaeia archaeon]MBS7279770.1 hypothetical protein [Candidatus Jordarchaeia archaeon]